MKNIFLLTFLSIILIGGILRFFNLASMPPSPNWDEISHGYNAYSILKTGSDEWGTKFPVSNFRAYGDYPLPLNLYFTLPFIYLFDLEVFTIRLPHALLGLGTVIFSYFLACGISKSKKIGLVTMFLVSIEPWFVFTSRFVLQSNLSVFLLTAAMALFFNRKKHRTFLTLSFVLLGLTLFSYHTTRIFTPLLLIGIFYIYRHEVLSKLNILVVLVFFLPLLFIIQNPDARARSNEVFLLNEGAKNTIEVARNSSNLPFMVKKLIYNRPTYFIKNFTTNYTGYFSPSFLFLNGGTQYQFSIPNHGVMNLSGLPFFYLGLASLLYRLRQKDGKPYKLLFFWLMLAPIPASITTEQYAVLRSTTLLPLPQLLVALGFMEFLNFIKKFAGSLYILLIFLYILISMLILTSFIKDYFGSYRTNFSWAWQYGYLDVSSFINTNYHKYDKFIVTKKYGEPHEFLLFYLKWDPFKFKNDSSLVRFYKSNWWWVDSFDKFVFMNDWQLPKNESIFVLESGVSVDCKTIKCALVTSDGNAPYDWTKLESIEFLNGKNAFEIYENK